MIKYRPHRGSLDDAMAGYHEFNSKRQLIRFLRNDLAPFIEINPKNIKIEKYFDHEDKRIGWKQTYIILYPHFGVIGFCDSWPASIEDNLISIGLIAGMIAAGIIKMIWGVGGGY